MFATSESETRTSQRASPVVTGLATNCTVSRCGASSPVTLVPAGSSAKSNTVPVAVSTNSTREARARAGPRRSMVASTGTISFENARFGAWTVAIAVSPTATSAPNTTEETVTPSAWSRRIRFRSGGSVVRPSVSKTTALTCRPDERDSACSIERERSD